MSAPHHALLSLRRHRLWLLLVLSGVAIALFPWTAYLSATLPSRHVTHHWDVAWSGFDLFEAAALIATVVALARCSRRVSVFAAVAGTALLSDAWFDVATAEPGREFGWALVEALAGEVPLAFLCFWIAVEAARLTSGGSSASAAGPLPAARLGRLVGGRAAPRTSGSGAPSEGRTSR